MESREIQVKTGKRAHRDQQDSQELPETQVLKETRATEERDSPDPEDPQDHLDLQDQALNRRLWTWRALGSTWNLSGAPLVSLVPPGPPVLQDPLAPALL